MQTRVERAAVGMMMTGAKVNNRENITTWIQNQTILITGGTGQIGKILIYKLLTCNVPVIYAVVRSKRGISAPDRLKHILETSTAFEGIRKTQPHLLQRVIPIVGDTATKGLGISKDDRESLRNEITVVFHAAASVSFDDQLTDAIFTNMQSTRDVMLLSQEIKNLKAVVHVSTAYTNQHHMHIEEKLYPPFMDWQKLLDAAEKLPKMKMNAISQLLLGVCPNTYIFTKKMSEDVVNSFRDTLPVVIFRPAIILGPKKEPFPGWMEAYTSPMAISGASAQGVLRVYGGPGDHHSMYVPLDICVNGLIAAAYKTAKYRPRLDEPLPVYNTRVIPLSPNQIKKQGFQMTKSHPFQKALWHPYFIPTETTYGFLFLHLLLHVLPGIFFDFLIQYTGASKLRLIKIYRKMYLTFDNLRPFITREWTYETKALESLEDLINQDPVDKVNFDMLEPTIDEMIRINYLGYRQFVGESETPTPKDLQSGRRLLWIDRVFKAILLTIALWIFPYKFLLNLLRGIIY